MMDLWLDMDAASPNGFRDMAWSDRGLGYGHSLLLLARLDDGTVFIFEVFFNGHKYDIHHANTQPLPNTLYIMLGLCRILGYSARM
jgi:hypothetical protein